MLAANQEIQRAQRKGVEPSFGIRRQLTEASAHAVSKVIFGLQEEGDIPPYPDVTLRDQLGVTILSKRTLGQRILRGMVTGYNLGRVRAQFDRHGAWEETDGNLPVSIDKFAVYQNRLIYAELEDNPLTDEIRAVEGILESAGVRGLSKGASPRKPRLVLGSADRARPISMVEQRHIVHRLEETVPPEVTVQDWESYPSNIFA